MNSAIPSQLKWAQVDHALRYVPVVSTLVSLVNLFQKAIFSYGRIDKEERNIYFTYIKDKNAWCCTILLIPIIGNLLILALDRNSHHLGKDKSCEGYLRRAKWGNVWAMHQIEHLVRIDKGIRLRYRYMAAARGSSEAMHSLGYAHEQANSGVEKSSDMAMMWFQLAAKKGNTQAMRSLGNRYEEGRQGFTKDLDQAAYWYREAVKHGAKNMDDTLARIQRSQSQKKNI